MWYNGDIKTRREALGSSAKDIHLRELKDTISQLKTMPSEQTELIRSLRLIIENKSSRKQKHLECEKVLQEQIGYLTKKLFGTSSGKNPLEIPDHLNLFNEAEQELFLPEQAVAGHMYSGILSMLFPRGSSTVSHPRKDSSSAISCFRWRTPTIKKHYFYEERKQFRL